MKHISATLFQSAMLLGSILLTACGGGANDAADGRESPDQTQTAPVITVQPAIQYIKPGQSATFTVVASGTGPLHYQWKMNGEKVGGDAASYITLAKTEANSGEKYLVVVSNSVGSVTSGEATLSVNSDPATLTITTQPQNQLVLTGDTASFVVIASGTAPLSYQWLKNGIPVAGATSASYTTQPTSDSDNGATFSVVVSDATGGSVTSRSATLSLSAQASDSSVLYGPYLQNVTQNGIAVMWTSDLGDAASVDYGTSTAYGSSVSANAVQLSGDGLSWWVRKATITALSPATTYHYRVRTSQGVGLDHTFVTAPAQAADFSFGVWGDSQGSGEPIVSYMRHMVEVEKVDLAFTTGDIAEDGTGMYQTRAMFLRHPAQIIGTRVPFFVAWGNHDGGADSYLRKHVDHPGTSNYSIDYAGCHFIFTDDFASEDEIVNFIQQDLASAAAKNARFIFLFNHRAPWTERWQDGSAWVRDRVVPLLKPGNVTVSFSGHMHAYERGYNDGVHYVTTGGGANALESVNDFVTDWPQVTVGGYSNPAPDPLNGGVINEYVKVEISGDTCTVKIMGFSADGSYLGVLDSFQVIK